MEGLCHIIQSHVSLGLKKQWISRTGTLTFAGGYCDSLHSLGIGGVLSVFLPGASLGFQQEQSCYLVALLAPAVKDKRDVRQVNSTLVGWGTCHWEAVKEFGLKFPCLATSLYPSRLCRYLWDLSPAISALNLRVKPVKAGQDEGLCGLTLLHLRNRGANPQRSGELRKKCSFPPVLFLLL